MTRIALAGATLVLPERLLDDHALLLDDGLITAIVRSAEVPLAYQVSTLDGGWLLPGFIDTQVNGGGDVLLNDQPSLGGIRSIASAHRRFGTTGLLPTLISDDPAIVDAAIAATEEALTAGVPGVLGVHIEGPHLNPDKRGIHDASRFTRIDAAVMDRLTRPTRGVRVVTLAPELAPAGAIRTLADAGVIVSAGHSLADYDATRTALGEGLAGFTHLFNAMTQLGSREPGMVGAALDDRDSLFGLIVDGVHVHPATLRVALAGQGLDRAMLVTDAMPPVGGTRSGFSLMGREISVIDGTCRGPDGTLAGSALSMAQAFRNAVNLLDLDMVKASRLASGNPARFLRIASTTGEIAVGRRADLVHLDPARRVVRTWIAGRVDETGEA